MQTGWSKVQLAFCASAVIAASIGCGHATKNMLHVTSVTPDAAVDVTGTLNGKAYALSVDRENVPLYVAYYEPIGVQDVGKDFPARFDPSSDEIFVQVPDKGTVRYTVQSARQEK